MLIHRSARCQGHVVWSESWRVCLSSTQGTSPKEAPPSFADQRVTVFWSPGVVCGAMIFNLCDNILRNSNRIKVLGRSRQLGAAVHVHNQLPGALSPARPRHFQLQLLESWNGRLGWRPLRSAFQDFYKPFNIYICSCSMEYAAGMPWCSMHPFIRYSQWGLGNKTL